MVQTARPASGVTLRWRNTALLRVFAKGFKRRQKWSDGMATTIRRILGSTILRDGQYASVTVELEDGTTDQLRFAYDGLDWIAHGLFSAAAAAHDVQANSQGVGPPKPPAQVVEASSCRAIADTAAKNVVLQIAGKDLATSRACLSTFSLTSQAVQVLALELMREGHKIK